MLHHQWGTGIAVLRTRRNVSIRTLLTEKGKGKVCPSQRRRWEESMTSSIVLPQGTQGQGLSGMNSHPQINWVQCLVAFSSRRENLLYQRTLYIPSSSCFCSAPCVLRYNGRHLSVPSVDTWHCIFDSFPCQRSDTAHFPRAGLSIRALCRKIPGVKLTHLLHYPEWCVACLLWAQASDSPQHISHKRDCK